MIRSCSDVLPVFRSLGLKSLLQVVVISACIPLILAACSNDESSLHQARLVAFGTLVDISTWGVNDDVAEQAIAAVETSFNDIDHTWHAWHPRCDQCH